MKPGFSKIVWQLLMVIGLAGVLVLAVLTFQSAVRLFSAIPEGEHKSETIPITAENISLQPEAKSGPDAGEHSYVIPAPAPVSAARPSSPPPARPADFKTDFKTIQEREQGRRETIDNLRKQARENPDADRNIPSEEQLKQIEASGADFM